MPSNRKGKWQPFDALEGYKDKLREAEKGNEKIIKPILSEDQELQITELLFKSLYTECVLIVHYFNEGQIEVYEGAFIKVDPENHLVTLNSNQKLKIVDIIELQEKN